MSIAACSRSSLSLAAAFVECFGQPPFFLFFFGGDSADRSCKAGVSLRFVGEGVTICSVVVWAGLDTPVGDDVSNVSSTVPVNVSSTVLVFELAAARFLSRAAS